MLCMSILCSCGNSPAPAETTAAQTTAETSAAAQADSETSAAAQDAAETSADTSAADAESTSEGYKVLLKDENGSPVSDVTVQFCSDTECILGYTGADGIALFDMPEGTYTIHLLEVPKGYAEDETEYTASAGTTEITLRSDGSADSETGEEKSDDNALKISDYGITLTLPQKYGDLKGTPDYSVEQLKRADPKVQKFSMDYYGFHKDDIDLLNSYIDEWEDAFLKGEEIPEPPRPHWDDWQHMNANVFTIYTIDSAAAEDQLRSYINEDKPEGSEIDLLEKLSVEGDTAFYLCRFGFNDEQTEHIKDYFGDLYDEFVELRSDKESFISGLELYKPIPLDIPEKNIGDVITFETTDLDGNKVTSEEIFKDHKVTMINLWATWCSPCKRELPELGEMAKEFEDKDCQIIGICLDAKNETAVDTAKGILSDTGCDYLNIAPPEDVNNILPATSIPTSYFVDSEGRIIAEKVVSAKVDLYPKTIDECLAAME